MANDDANAQVFQALFNLTRTPDPIKFLPNYDGNSNNLHSWIDQVESALGVFQMVENTPLYTTWVKLIRSKIVGKAHEALVSSCIDQEANWPRIKAVLIEHFGDKRDISTLVQGIPYMRQKNLTVDEFYQEMCTAAADVSQKLGLHPVFGINARVIMEFMNSIIANAFVDGLNDPISGLVRSSRPETLVDAYRVAKDHDLARSRKAMKNETRPRNANFSQNKTPQRGFNKPFNAQNPSSSASKATDGQNNASNAQKNFSKPTGTQFSPNNGARGANALKSFGNTPSTSKDDNKSSQSKVSNVPMSGISYRSQTNNVEEEEEEIDNIESEVEEDDDDVNFQMQSLYVTQT